MRVNVADAKNAHTKHKNAIPTTLVDTIKKDAAAACTVHPQNVR